MYNKMLLNRIKPYLEKIFRTNQNGFREGRSTIGQILTLRKVIEEVQINNIPAVLAFIHQQRKIISNTGIYGIPQTLGAMKSAYVNTTAQVITEDDNTDFFNIEAGVLQGDTLAPYLFIIMVDYIMRKSTNGAENLGLTLRKDTDFADDIALLSDTTDDAQNLLTLVVEAAENVGLNINEDTAEYMTYNIKSSTKLEANGKPLKKVNYFKYLGSWVDSSPRDMKIRKTSMDGNT
ncbi:uncharacterized protein LOC125042107 [Penaeus chinensis]|uniref:uncharacterized protein LOC125042107 n=1 Tax=Penaeus chinensis TaxID=139456 RepID=UPI001FB6F7C1|nr:uncharacterized protein LOC125042107 [Penaeus chinensis]